MILVQTKEAKTNYLSTKLIHPFQPVWRMAFAIPALEIKHPSWDFKWLQPLSMRTSRSLDNSYLNSKPHLKQQYHKPAVFLPRKTINQPKTPLQCIANIEPGQSKTLMHRLRCLAWCLEARNLDVAHVPQLHQDMRAILRRDAWHFSRGGVVEKENKKMRKKQGGACMSYVTSTSLRYVVSWSVLSCHCVLHFVMFWCFVVVCTVFSSI